MKYGQITVSQTIQPNEMQIKKIVIKAGILMQSQTTASVSSRCFNGVFIGATFKYGPFFCLRLRPLPLPLTDRVVDAVDSSDSVEMELICDDVESCVADLFFFCLNALLVVSNTDDPVVEVVSGLA